MNPSRAIKILAACGVALAGPVTSDALAFARAIDIGSRNALLLFAQENPRSVHAMEAVRLSGGMARLSTTEFALYVPNSPEPGITSGNNGKVLKAAGREGTVRGDVKSPDKKNKPATHPATKKNTALQKQVVSEINSKLRVFKRDSEDCRGRNFGNTQDCVADALEKFSRGLASVKRAPGSVATVGVPALRQAAKRVRAAKNKKEARAAVAAAIPVIRKSINLVMAGDEDSVYRLQVQQRSLVIQSLTVADRVLVQATGI